MGILGERIRLAREDAGLLTKQLAQAVGVDPNTVSRWENGYREPRRAMLRRIAAALGKPPAWFLGGDDAQQTIRLTIDGQTFEGTPEQIAELSARLTPKDANTEPGVAALLADEALCRSLGITEADRAVLVAIRANGLIRTAQQAIVVLQALRH